MKPYKVYGGCFNGKDRWIVAAKSIQKAADAFGVSYGYCRGRCSTTGNKLECELTRANPGVVFTTNAVHTSTYTQRDQK